jgi:hypothetical protein
MTEYFLGGLLDMPGVERKPPGFDILHDFSFCGRHRADWAQSHGSNSDVPKVSIQRLRNQEASRRIT